MKKNKPLLHDPHIINRVKLYLEENVEQTYLDVGVMTKQLQERYPEYSRRKVAPFRSLVEEAYRIVSQSYGMESQPSSGNDSEGSDLEMMENQSGNVMNSMMSSLYANRKSVGGKSDSGGVSTAGSKSVAGAAAEAIDISSDESGDERDGPAESNGRGAAQEKSKIYPKSLPSMNFRSVVGAKFGNIEEKGVGSATLGTNTVTTSSAGGHKRNENTSYLEQQPNKKQKYNNASQSNNSNNNSGGGGGGNNGTGSGGGGGNPQTMQHNLQQYRLTGQYNQNSNDSGTFPAPSLRPQKKYKKDVVLRKSRETFQDIGGMEKTLKELCELLMHIKSPDIYFVLGLMPPRGILLHGPPGCGKTLLAHAIAGQLNLALIEVPATELIAGVSGESEERIRDVFEQAAAAAPCVLFIDEIDAISSNRTYAQKDMERRIVSQLISSLDSLKSSEGGQAVLVVGATTRPDVLDPSLRRVGRFDHEVKIGIPNRKDRKDILTIICDVLSVEPKIDYDKIAELTPGYVGADLLALVSRAATIAVKRKYSEQMRAFQVKAQRNITIVDLDDDGDDVDGAAGDGIKSTKDDAVADKEKDTEESNETAPKDGGDEGSEAMAVEKKSDKEEDPKPAEEMEVDESDKDAVVSEGKEPETADSNGDPEKATTETDETGTDENGDVDEEEANVKVAEPTLFELLNWLDNPPEDIAYVSDFSITFEDFAEAVKLVQPSAKREGFITVPDVTWDDVGSLQDVREELKLAVLAPVKFPEKLARLGLSAPSGVLLCGPPGCGKTLLAKAIANEAGINFISVKGPELMNMYVGESERAVRACFQRARNSAPCVIFFDEFDSLCPKRSDGNDGGSGTRVVNQLLTEMDGVEDRQGVYILAATNRPDIIDPAILRPGRLDTILYVGLPKREDRVEILRATTKNRTRPVLAEDVDFVVLAAKTEGYTGADLAGLVRQAAMLALKESLDNAAAAAATDDDSNDLCVRRAHFDQALKMLRPSVNAQDQKIYEKLRLKYAAPHVPSLLDDPVAV